MYQFNAKITRAGLDKMVGMNAKERDGLHKLVWNLFHDGKKYNHKEREFIFHYDSSRHMIQVRSDTKPNRDVPHFDVGDISEMPESATTGVQFPFLLEFNSTLQRSGKEHDIVSDYKFHLDRGEAEPPTELIRLKSAIEWFGRRPDKGFDLVQPKQTMKVTSHTKHPMPSHYMPCLATMRVEGILEISDEESFLDTYHHGLGRKKAFGCGLILLMP